MTAQKMERLTYDGKVLAMAAEPLGKWLQMKRNRGIRFKMRNTAHRRGYVGHWEVIEKRLYLASIDGTLVDGKQINLADLFPESPERAFADWVTGEIRCPTGKLLGYSHAGYSSVYEWDMFLRFENGVLIDTRIVKNEAPPPMEEIDMGDINNSI